MYKYSRDYDEIINVSADIDFIDTFLRGSGDLKQAQHQLEVLYLREKHIKECNEKLSMGVLTQLSAYLLTQLVLRNLVIIQRCVFIEKSKREGKDDESISQQVDEYDSQIMDYTIDVIGRIVGEADYRGVNYYGKYDILGHSRDIELYRRIYNEYMMFNSPERKENAKEKVFAYKKYSSKKGGI